jgi:hypothetical protein
LTALPDYLDLCELLRGETDLNVWTTAVGSWHHVHRILDDAQSLTLAERLRAVLSPALERLAWSPRSDESDLDRQLRGDLIAALGIVGEDGACQERARSLHAEYERDTAAVDRNLVPALIAIIAHTGGAADYEKFYAKFKSAQTPQEEQRYLFALASFRRPELIDRTLALTVNGDVRTQNAPYLMRNLLLNKDAREPAWFFLKSHWEDMLRKYPDNSIPRMCEGIIGLVSPELESQARKFFAEHPVVQGAKQIEQHLERLRVAVLCQQRWKDLLRA